MKVALPDGEQYSLVLSAEELAAIDKIKILDKINGTDQVSEYRGEIFKSIVHRLDRPAVPLVDLPEKSFSTLLHVSKKGQEGV